MYAITGITGKVGGALARSLLADHLPVRAVLRDEAKAGSEWRARGCEVAIAEVDDAASLAAAFKDAEGVFVLPPSEFDPAGFPEARRVIAAVTGRARLGSSAKDRVPVRPSVPAAPHENLLTQRTLMEEALGGARPGGHLPAARLVHGECAMGHSRRARRGRAAQLPAARRQAVPDDRDRGCRPHSRLFCCARTGAERGS